MRESSESKAKASDAENLINQQESNMTEQLNTNPSMDELRAFDLATAEMLTTFFKQAGIHPGVAAVLLANATGRLVNNMAEPEDVERSLDSVFKIIRMQAEGQTTETVWQ
jgi:hypothetical protein